MNFLWLVVGLILFFGTLIFLSLSNNIWGRQVDRGMFEWSFSEAGTRALDQAPLVSVLLRTRSTIYPVGIFAGECVPIENESPNELSAALCWWQQNGIEIGVFQEIGYKQLRAIERTGDTYPGVRDLSKTRAILNLNANE